MRKLIITNDPYQEFEYEQGEDIFTFTIKYIEITQTWYIQQLKRNDEVILNNRKLSLGNFNLKGLNLPIEVIIEDNFLSGIDPFLLNDFENRCNFVIIEKSELEEIYQRSIK